MGFQERLDIALETIESYTYGLFTKPRAPGEEWYLNNGINALSRKQAIAKFRELYGPDLDKKEWKVREIGPEDCKILTDEEFIKMRDLFAHNRASKLEMDKEREQEREQQTYE